MRIGRRRGSEFWLTRDFHRCDSLEEEVKAFVALLDRVLSDEGMDKGRKVKGEESKGDESRVE